MNREEAVRNEKLFLDTLGIDKHPTDHAYCPFHGEERGSSNSPSLMTRVQDDGTHYFKCHSCGVKGTVIDAIMELRNTDFKGAAQILGIEMQGYRPMPLSVNNAVNNGSPPRKPKTPSEPLIPVPDGEKMEAYISSKREDMYRDLNGQTAIEFLYEKRKITDEVATEYSIGVDRLSFDDSGRITRCQWVLPITNDAGVCYGVKTHWEGNRPINPKTGRKVPKCLWRKFGTMPKDKPIHRYITAWPAPETFNAEHWLFLHGGELKALSMLSAGANACAITASESFEWTPKLLGRFKGRKVCLIYDDDELKINKRTGAQWKPGEKWRDRGLEALRTVATNVEALTFWECLSG